MTCPSLFRGVRYGGVEPTLTPAEVDRLTLSRALYAAQTGTGPRYPCFQFTDNLDALVPNISQVLQALSPDHWVVSINNWLHHADPDCELDGVAISPREWLLAGQDPTNLVLLARDL